MSDSGSSEDGETYSCFSLLQVAQSLNGEEEKMKDILRILTSKLQNRPNGETLQKSSQGSLFGDCVDSKSFDDRTLLDHRGNSPLFWACLFGQHETVDMLITQFHMHVNRQNKDGETPLAVGVKSGSFDVVCTLLDHGANPNIPNLKAETPLHYASCLGYSDICKELIKFGGWIDVEDDCGDTPLHWAVREEQIEVIEILLSLGADPYHLNEDDESPLNLAESGCSEALVNTFDSITYSVDIDIGLAGFSFSNDREHSKENSMLMCTVMIL